MTSYSNHTIQMSGIQNLHDFVHVLFCTSPPVVVYFRSNLVLRLRLRWYTISSLTPIMFEQLSKRLRTLRDFCVLLLTKEVSRSRRATGEKLGIIRARSAVAV